MTKYSGEDLVITWQGHDISGVSRALEIEEETTEIDVTAYGSEDYEYITTKKKQRRGSFTVMDSRGSAGTMLEALLNAGQSGTLTWSPEGTATGNRLKTVEAVILRSRKSYPHDDAVSFSTEIRLSGGVTETVHGS